MMGANAAIILLCYQIKMIGKNLNCEYRFFCFSVIFRGMAMPDLNRQAYKNVQQH